MEANVTFYLLLAAAYLLGSISSAIIVCRLMGLPDPRTVGSNNPGATNVLRVGGKKAAAVKRHYKRVRSMQLPKKLY